jgi:hypothetical protein
VREKLKLVEQYVIIMGLSCLQVGVDSGNMLGKWSVCLSFHSGNTVYMQNTTDCKLSTVCDHMLLPRPSSMLYCHGDVPSARRPFRHVHY